jgi:hypothetical protein
MLVKIKTQRHKQVCSSYSDYVYVLISYIDNIYIYISNIVCNTLSILIVYLKYYYKLYNYCLIHIYIYIFILFLSYDLVPTRVRVYIILFKTD